MVSEIQKLKKQKNAVILAHFYQPQEIQEIADRTGDSLELAQFAQNCEADIIVFCGVDFMGESAKLLSPQKTVLLPVKSATCPMANMITADDVKKLRAKYPEAAVVTYINSSVNVKAESDICCTSSNAVKIVNSLKNQQIIFIPDKNLGSYVSRFTDKQIILFDGCCPIHDRIQKEDFIAAKKLHPEALIAVHPECPREITDNADFCGSTSAIINFVSSSKNKEFIIGTEEGILYTLKKQNPDKIFYPLTDNFICEDMKKITLADVYSSLLTNTHSVELEQDIIDRASVSLKKMMEVSK